MSFIPGKPFISYKHLEAKTPEELEEKMLEISMKSSFVTNFSAPTYSEKKWHTWYLYDYSKDIKAKDKLDMANTK